MMRGSRVGSFGCGKATAPVIGRGFARGGRMILVFAIAAGCSGAGSTSGAGGKGRGGSDGGLGGMGGGPSVGTAGVGGAPAGSGGMGGHGGIAGGPGPDGKGGGAGSGAGIGGVRGGAAGSGGTIGGAAGGGVSGISGVGGAGGMGVVPQPCPGATLVTDQIDHFFLARPDARDFYWVDYDFFAGSAAAPGLLKKVSADGGPPTTIFSNNGPNALNGGAIYDVADDNDNLYVNTWSRNATSPMLTDYIWKVPKNGDAPTPLLTTDLSLPSNPIGVQPTKGIRNKMVSDGKRLYFMGNSNPDAPGSWAAAVPGYGSEGVYSIATASAPAKSFVQICAQGPADAPGWSLSPDGAALGNSCGNPDGSITIANGNVYMTGPFLLSFPAAGSATPSPPVNLFPPTFRWGHAADLMIGVPLITSGGGIFWFDESLGNTLYKVPESGGEPEALFENPGWGFEFADAAAYKGKIYFVSAETAGTEAHYFITAVVMDGSDHGVGENVSETFDFAYSFPSSVYASDAGLFAVVAVRGKTISDITYRAYLCP